MDSSSYLLVSLAVGSLLLLAAGVLWMVARRMTPSVADTETRRPAESLRQLSGLISSWVFTGLQLLCGFTLFGIAGDVSETRDVLAAITSLSGMATLVINTLLTFRWLQFRVSEPNLEPAKRPMPLLIAYSVVLAAVALSHVGVFAWRMTQGEIAMRPESTMVWLGSIVALFGGWCVVAFNEYGPRRPTTERRPVLLGVRVFMQICAAVFLILGMLLWMVVTLFWFWLLIIPGVLSILVILSTLAARSRAGELTTLWTLSIAGQSGSLRGPQLWQHMSRVQGPTQWRLKRLAALLGDGEPLDLALQRCRIIPRGCSMEIQAALDADRLSEALRSAAARETKRFSQGPEVTEAFSLSYFALIINVMIFITGFLMYYIIPKFKKIFDDFGTELPQMTILLIHISDGFVNYWYLFLPWILPASFFGLWCDMQARFYGWRALFERLFGSYWPRLRSPDVLRGLAWSIRGGRPLAESFAAMTLGRSSLSIRQRLRRIAEKVRNGEDPWQALAQNGWLTGAECEALRRAQSVGNLPWVLDALADADEQRWERRMCYSLQFIRPVLITVMGLMVAFITIALFMPLVKLLNDLS